jgi:hypothetical protein
MDCSLNFLAASFAVFESGRRLPDQTGRKTIGSLADPWNRNPVSLPFTSVVITYNAKQLYAGGRASNLLGNVTNRLGTLLLIEINSIRVGGPITLYGIVVRIIAITLQVQVDFMVCVILPVADQSLINIGF